MNFFTSFVKTVVMFVSMNESRASFHVMNLFYSWLSENIWNNTSIILSHYMNASLIHYTICSLYENIIDFQVNWKETIAHFKYRPLKQLLETSKVNSHVAIYFVDLLFYIGLLRLCLFPNDHMTLTQFFFP